MSKKVFQLSDFDSRSCDIEMQGADGESVLTLSLRKFTLLDRIWVEREFGSVEKWEKIIFPVSEDHSEIVWIETVLKTVHHLLEPKDKKHFADWEALAGELESSIEMIMGLQKALLYVLKGSEPLIDRFEQEVKKNLEALKNPKKATKKKSRKKATRKTGRK